MLVKYSQAYNSICQVFPLFKDRSNFSLFETVRKFTTDKRLLEILKHSSSKDVFIHFYKLHRCIAVQTSLFSIKSFNYIFPFVYWNRLETERGNIFWFHVFDTCYTRMMLMLLLLIIITTTDYINIIAKRIKLLFLKIVFWLRIYILYICLFLFFK